MAKSAKTEAKQHKPLPVPTSLNEAMAYQMAVRERLTILSSLNAKLSEVQDDIKEQAAELARYGEALYQFTDTNRDTLMASYEKTLHIAGVGNLGWVAGKRVVIGYAADRVIRWLKRNKLARFVRRGKESIDKEALRKEPEMVAKIPGVRIDDSELFSIRITGQSLRLERDPVTGEWSVKSSEKKKAPAPLAEAAE